MCVFVGEVDCWHLFCFHVQYFQEWLSHLGPAASCWRLQCLTVLCFDCPFCRFTWFVCSSRLVLSRPLCLPLSVVVLCPSVVLAWVLSSAVVLLISCVGVTSSSRGTLDPWHRQGNWTKIMTWPATGDTSIWPSKVCYITTHSQLFFQALFLLSLHSSMVWPQVTEAWNRQGNWTETIITQPATGDTSIWPSKACYIPTHSQVFFQALFHLFCIFIGLHFYFTE